MTAALVLFDDTDDLVRAAPPPGVPGELDGAVTLEAAPEPGLCPADSEQLLLQLDFRQQPVFELGEGRLYFFIAPDDLAAGRLDRARLVPQQT